MDKNDQLNKALDAYQVSLAIEGDRAAFALLYKRWYPRLLRFATRLVQHPDDALDVMQDSAMAIARNIHRLQDPTRFAPWAFTIVRRRAADHIKRAVRRRDVADHVANSATPFAQPQSSESIALEQALAKLKPADQALLTLFYLEDLTGPELAAAMGIPLGTLKSRLFDARQHLKSAYETTDTGEPND